MVPSKKRAVIFGEPICWRCWAIDLNREERGKVVRSKRCGGPLANPISLAASRPNGRGRAGMRKTGSFEKKYWHLLVGLTPGFRSEQSE